MQLASCWPKLLQDGPERCRLEYSWGAPGQSLCWALSFIICKIGIKEYLTQVYTYVYLEKVHIQFTILKYTIKCFNIFIELCNCLHYLILNILFTSKTLRTSLVIQWLRLCATNAEGPGLIPGQETRAHMLQLSLRMSPQRSNSPHATTKTRCSQINNKTKQKETLHSLAVILHSPVSLAPGDH